MQQNCIYIYAMKILSPVQVDRLGITAAIACALHCAALPFAITYLPLLGLNFLANIWVEIGMICISIFLGCYSLAKSYPKHKNSLPIALLALGFITIGLGHFLLHTLEAFLVPIGGIILAIAHFWNWRFLKRCSHQ